jgi:hypothetical protein
LAILARGFGLCWSSSITSLLGGGVDRQVKQIPPGYWSTNDSFAAAFLDQNKAIFHVLVKPAIRAVFKSQEFRDGKTSESKAVIQSELMRL